MGCICDTGQTECLFSPMKSSDIVPENGWYELLICETVLAGSVYYNDDDRKQGEGDMAITAHFISSSTSSAPMGNRSCWKQPMASLSPLIIFDILYNQSIVTIWNLQNNIVGFELYSLSTFWLSFLSDASRSARYKDAAIPYAVFCPSRNPKQPNTPVEAEKYTRANDNNIGELGVASIAWRECTQSAVNHYFLVCNERIGMMDVFGLLHTAVHHIVLYNFWKGYAALQDNLNRELQHHRGDIALG